MWPAEEFSNKAYEKRPKNNINDCGTVYGITRYRCGNGIAGYCVSGKSNAGCKHQINTDDSEYTVYMSYFLPTNLCKIDNGGKEEKTAFNCVYIDADWIYRPYVCK